MDFMGTIEVVFQAAVVASVRWTPLFLAMCLAARFLPAASEKKNLWLFALIALPVLPLVGGIIPSWTVPDWQAAAGLEIAEEVASPAPGRESFGSVAVASSPAAAKSSHWLAGLWCLGVAALLARELLSRLAAFNLGRSALEAPEWLREEASKAAEAYGLGPLDVRLAEVKVPLLCGVLHPRVVLPTTSVSWPKARLRASLLHELAHQRHRDPWIDLFSRMIAAAFFFHPGVWAARRALGREMEKAADAAVVDRGTFDKATYGRVLIDIARQARGFAPGLAMARPGSGLEARLIALMAESDRASWRRRILVFSMLAFLALAAAGLSSGLAAGAERWFSETEDGWLLRCGGDSECRAIQDQAGRLLKEVDRAGALLVQKVETGEVVAYAARGPAPVPLVPPASVAKLAVATLWWDGGFGDQQIPCAGTWTAPGGIEVRSIKDRGEIEAPHEMLIYSCTTASGIMVERLLKASGAESVEASLSRFGFADGAVGSSLPDFLPRPRIDDGPEWEKKEPEMAAALGRVSTTPFHIASFLQAIGHGGERRTMRRPGQGEGSAERLMTPETAERLRLSMAAVVSDGTGRRANKILDGASWQLIGKTGTRARNDGAYDGWFAGLVTDSEQRPRYAVVAFLDGAGYGSDEPTELAAHMTRALGSLGL